MIIAVVALLPLNFRMSRAAWINLFVTYKKPEHS
jgi:hypothetical protein